MTSTRRSLTYVQGLLALSVALAALCPQTLVAQVNIEPFSLGEDVYGWNARLGADFKMESNDTVLLEIDLSPRVDYAWENNAVSTVGSLGFSERSGTTFRSQSLLHTRYLRRIDSTSSLEVFTRIARDEFALLNRRVASGVGIRLKVSAEDESVTFAGISLGYEGERWDVEPDDRHPETLDDPRSFGYVAYRVQITETTTLINTLRASLRLADDFDDGRITDTATLQVEISERVSLDASFGLEFDNRPPQSQPEVSMALTNGLVVTL